MRNDARHDSRVGRELGVMRELGLDPVVVAVTTVYANAPRSTLAGAPVVRLSPRFPLGRLARRFAVDALAARSAPTGGSRAAPRVSLRLRLYRLGRTSDFIRRGVGAIRALRPELLHCNDHNTMWIGVLAKLAFGTPVVYDAHELWPDRNGRWEWRPWLLLSEAAFVRLADAVVTASPGYADEMVRRYRIARPTVVRNVPDHPPRADVVPDGERDGAVYVGGLMPGRGLEVAIRALAAAPDVTLTLLGPGHPAYVDRLRALAAELEVGERLVVAPPVPPNAVIDRIAGYGVGLSLIEPICRSYELTLPNKLFEYMLAGLPVLASDVPTQAAFVREHELGETVSLADPAAVGAALRRLARGGPRAVADGPRWSDERRELERVYRAVAPPLRQKKPVQSIC